MRTFKSWLIVPIAFLLIACQTTPMNPITTVKQVDLERFMGDWYVIANIPTFIERDAYNAVESYRLTDEGTVATTFTFRQGGFEGERKVYTPTGFVRDRDSNAVWGMQFIWPIKADFRIVYLDEHYTRTIIGRNKRDYVWIMVRTPSIPEADYQNLLRLLADEGYDINQIQRVPQRWPEANGAGLAPGRHGGARGLSGCRFEQFNRGLANAAGGGDHYKTSHGFLLECWVTKAVIGLAELDLGMRSGCLLIARVGLIDLTSPLNARNIVPSLGKATHDRRQS